MKYLVSFCLVVVGVIHLLPLSGFISAEKLMSLYGIKISDPNVEILMRHRAVLFGVLGAFLIYAAFQPSVQPLAFVAGFVSVVAYLYLLISIGNYNPLLKRVFAVDIVAVVLLLIGSIGYFVNSKAQ